MKLSRLSILAMAALSCAAFAISCESDDASALAPFWVWSALGYALAPVKSLANLVEPIWCGWFFSALLALRAVFALREKRLRVNIWGYATMAAVLLGIVLLLLLVPPLPE